MAYPKQEGFVQPYEGPAPLPGGNSFPADLDEAIKRGHQAGIGHFLINNPDQINLPGFNGQRPIHMACYRGDDKLVKVFSWFLSEHNCQHLIAKKLVDHGADVNLGTNFGETPIISAAQAGSLPLFDYLLNNGNIQKKFIFSNLYLKVPTQRQPIKKGLASVTMPVARVSLVSFITWSIDNYSTLKRTIHLAIRRCTRL